MLSQPGESILSAQLEIPHWPICSHREACCYPSDQQGGPGSRLSSHQYRGGAGDQTRSLSADFTLTPLAFSPRGRCLGPQREAIPITAFKIACLPRQPVHGSPCGLPTDAWRSAPIA